ncbi:MAG: hypothetical protein HKN54_11940 [Flavobacteriaceae bacterium]|nr:hypothetical protein [Flavobacteriaceae bacterium]
MRVIVAALFLCVSLLTYGQQKDIDFQIDEADNSLSIFCLNNSDSHQEVVLSILDIKGLTGYTNPIKKVLAPQTRTHFLDMTYDIVYEYKLSYTKKAVQSEEEIIAKARKKESLYLDDFSKLNEGIVIFDDIECTRCSYATNYLMEKNIDFKIVNISDNKENLKLMWKTIKEKGHSMHVKTPVIMVNGELSHSHTDLHNFLEGLK